MKPAWHQICVRCGEPMEEGFTLTRSPEGASDLPVWFAGEPDKRWWGFAGLKKTRQYRVRTIRCTGCGHLDHYATEPAER